MKTVTAADANRYFSKLLADVKRGETVVVTSHGTPVAKIIPAEDEALVKRRKEAWARIEEMWAQQQPMHLGKFNRDDAYDD